MFQNIVECSSTLKSKRLLHSIEYSIIFENVLDSSRMFKNILEFRIFWNFQKCSGIFENVLEYHNNATSIENNQMIRDGCMDGQTNNTQV